MAHAYYPSIKEVEMGDLEFKVILSLKIRSLMSSSSGTQVQTGLHELTQKDK